MDIFFKYTHELVMFLAVALSMGGTMLLFKVVKSESTTAIRSIFVLLRPTVKAIGPVYGIGTLLGLLAGWLGGLPLLSFWLVAAYAITILAAVLGEITKRWALKVAALAEANEDDKPGPELAAALAQKAPLTVRRLDMVILVVIIALMVFRPSFW